MEDKNGLLPITLSQIPIVCVFPLSPFVFRFRSTFFMGTREVLKASIERLLPNDYAAVVVDFLSLYFYFRLHPTNVPTVNT